MVYRAFTFALLIVLTAATTNAAQYDIHRIFDGTNYRLGQYPQLDASGAVYFGATPKSNNHAATIYRGTLDSVTPLVESGGVFLGVGFQSVNGLGEIAFSASTGGDAELYRTHNGSFQQIPFPSAEFQPIETKYNRVWINDSGTVVYPGQVPEGTGAVLTIASSLSETPLVTAGPGHPFADLRIRVDSFGLPATTALNNHGDVAFWGSTSTILDGLFLVRQDGQVSVLFDNMSDEFGAASYVLDLNDHGEVVIAGFFHGGDEEVAVLAKLHDGNLTVLGDTSGDFAVDPLALWDLNNAGDIAIFIALDDGRRGIFSGPDAVANKVIAQGDPLDGSTVVNVLFHRGLNDAGQIAFWAELADGRYGIYRADPVPEPSTIVLAGLGAIALLVTLLRNRLTAC